MLAMRSMSLSVILHLLSLAEDGMGPGPSVASDDRLFRRDASESTECSIA